MTSRGSALMRVSAPVRHAVPFTNALFSARARLMLGKLQAEQVNGFLSGLLIGREAAEFSADGQQVHLIGDGRLLDRYERALAACGVASVAHPGDDLSIAGLRAIAGCQ